MPRLRRHTLGWTAAWPLCLLLAAVGACADGESRSSGSSKQSPTTGSPTDWPAFRGPTGQGASAAMLPAEWSDEKNIVWKTELPGAGASSPVVFGDRIYLTAYSGYFVPGEAEGSLENLKRHLIAIDRKNGQIVWDRPVAAKLPEEERIRDHGFAASTPAVDAERIYVFFGKTGVLAFDHDGNQVWQREVGSNTRDWGSAASPVLYDDLVLINASVESESLIALNRETGKIEWNAPGIKDSWSTPVVVTATSGRAELIIPVQGKVLAFDLESGKSLWSCDTDIGWYMVPSVVEAEGVVYCLGGRSGVAALAVKTGGSGDVTRTHRLWTKTKGSNVTSPVYHDGHLYWAHESRGVAYCADAKTGEVLYEERLPRGGQVYASTILAGDKIYHLTREGRTFVLAAKPEYEEISVNDLPDGSMFNATPAIDGNRLLIRSDKFLYCIGQ